MITNTTQGQKSLALLLDEFEEEYKSATKPEHFYALALLVPLLVKALRRAMVSLEVTHCDAALSDMAAILEEKEA